MSVILEFLEGLVDTSPHNMRVLDPRLFSTTSPRPHHGLSSWPLHGTELLTRNLAGAINDKTIVKFDPYVSAIRNGSLKDITWKYYNIDGTLTDEQGGYLICDGGYHRWRCLVSPNKMSSEFWAAKWTQQVIHPMPTSLVHDHY